MSGHSEDSFQSPPLIDLPLPASTAAAVESLLPPRGRPTRGPRERGQLGYFEPIPEEAAAKWLGFPPLTLPSLCESGFSQHFARQGGRDLVARADLTPADSAAVYAFYLPAGSHWRQETSFAEARREGLTFLWLRAGSGVPWPEEEGEPVGVEDTATIGRDPTSGDFLTVTVGSHRVGVQHQRGVTRLAWVYRSRDAEFNVTVMSGRSPLASLQMLVSDRGALHLS